MGTDASRNPTELEDFLAVLTQTDDEGQPFVVVGGQPDRPRQDVKHVAMLALCVPHFLEDVCIRVADKGRRKDTLRNYIQALTALKHNYSGRLFEARHPGMIHWPELISQTIRQMPFDWQIQSSLRQLDSGGQSRGMRI